MHLVSPAVFKPWLACLLLVVLVTGRHGYLAVVAEGSECEKDAVSLAHLKRTLLDYDLLYLAEQRPQGDTDQLKENLLLVAEVGKEEDVAEGSRETDQGVRFDRVTSGLTEFGVGTPVFQVFYVPASFLKEYFQGAEDGQPTQAVCLKKGTPLESVPYFYEVSIYLLVFICQRLCSFLLSACSLELFQQCQVKGSLLQVVYWEVPDC